MTPVTPMRVLYAIGAPEPLGRAVCAISAFDGVHRGHQRLAERAASLAAEQGIPVVAAVVWEGERPIAGAGPQQLLALLDERLTLLGRLGRFDAALALSQAPDATPSAADADAVIEAIMRWMEPIALLVGDEPGVPEGIATAAARRGVRMVLLASRGADEVEADLENTLDYRLEHDGARARTTIGERIAELLLAGDVRAATARLGHPYAVTGVVVAGDRRGRVLGYPTANLRLDARKRLPADGIYAVRARLPGETDATHAAVASLGVRPQFGDYGPRLLEVYLLDAAVDLYGLPLGVEFVERLREERRFADVAALKEQMARDVEVARDVLNEDGASDRGRAMARSGER